MKFIVLVVIDSMINRLKELYTMIKDHSLQWHDYFPNNMPCNGKSGIYTYFFLHDDNITFIKYTIEYQHPMTSSFVELNDKPIKYYILHQYKDDNLSNELLIPEPNNNYTMDVKDGYFSPDIVNNFGKFLAVFDDEAIAKESIYANMNMIIYFYLYFLNEKQLDEWNEFIK